jgi:hypothetical protein
VAIDNILLLHFSGKPTMDCSILVLHIYSRDVRVRACRKRVGTRCLKVRKGSGFVYFAQFY